MRYVVLGLPDDADAERWVRAYDRPRTWRSLWLRLRCALAPCAAVTALGHTTWASLRGLANCVEHADQR